MGSQSSMLPSVEVDQLRASLREQKTSPPDLVRQEIGFALSMRNWSAN